MAPLQPMGIQAIAKGVGTFNRQVDSMNKSVDKGNKALAKTEKTSLGLDKTMVALGAAVGVATAAMLVAKKAFDIGREGALITQTGESFEFLLEKVGAAPNLLGQLTEASKGTISELDLMTSTATLLAGAGDELAGKLADATPRLLEIAKAANKLNPSLGSTAFLYQSIATGVKRAQPLILDNLGITIKVGKANEDFAKSIGKTVDELTAEEKAMAILQGTLEAGDNLINQVGGNTDSATDSFDRLTVALGVTTDRAKVALFEGIQPLVNTMADAVIQGNMLNAAVEELELSVGKFGIVTDATGLVITKTTEEIIAAAEENRLFLQSIDATVIDGWAAAILGVKGESEGLAAANRDIVLSMQELSEQKLAQEALTALNEAYKAGTIDAETYKEEFFRVSTEMGGLEAPMARGQIALFELKEELAAGTITAMGFVAEMEALAAFGGKVYVTTHIIRTIHEGGGFQEFQHGGQFVVGGKPGVDQNLVAFKASRGEVVTVTPANQVDNSRRGVMGDVNIRGGGIDMKVFDQMMRTWLGS